MSATRVRWGVVGTDVLEQIRERLADERDRHQLASREDTVHA